METSVVYLVAVICNMENFNAEILINPELIQSALITVNGKVCRVLDMDLHNIYVETVDGKGLAITSKGWIGIFLDDQWVERLMGTTHAIRNQKTLQNWVVRKSGMYRYLTIENDKNHLGKIQ